MYWIMFTERNTDEETILFGVPPLIDELDLECDEGEMLTGGYPVIEFTPEEEFHTLADNLSAPGFGGLLANKRVTDTLKSLDVNNIQLFEVLLRGVNDGQDCSDYDLINIIGDFDIIDYEKSDVVLRCPGDIKRIKSLSFIDTSEMMLPPIFRLTSFLPLVIAHDSVKQEFEAKNITGFTFYQAEGFSL